jgi:hypothetical protein
MFLIYYFTASFTTSFTTDLYLYFPGSDAPVPKASQHAAMYLIYYFTASFTTTFTTDLYLYFPGSDAPVPKAPHNLQLCTSFTTTPGLIYY